MKRTRHIQRHSQGVAHTFNDLSDIWNVVWGILMVVAVTLTAVAPAVVLSIWRAVL